MFSQTLAETITIENLKLILKLGIPMKKFLKWWSVQNHKSFEKGYSMIIYSKTMTEIVAIKIFEHGICE